MPLILLNPIWIFTRNHVVRPYNIHIIYLKFRGPSSLDFHRIVTKLWTFSPRLLVYNKEKEKNPHHHISVFYLRQQGSSQLSIDTGPDNTQSPPALIASLIIVKPITIIIIIIRARWHYQCQYFYSRRVYSYVKLNLKASLFSWIFWFEDSLLTKIALLVLGVFTL